MAIIFYEGFNYSNSNIPKIDNNYWSTDNLAGISYNTGRTDNQIEIPTFSSLLPDASGSYLMLSNFVDPLSTDNCFAIGCSHGDNSIKTRYNESAPARARFMEFRDSANQVVLSLNIIKTTYNSLSSVAIEVVQSSTVVATYDFRSYVGHSWNIQPEYVNSRIYLEIFIDAKNNNKISIRASQDGGTIHGQLLNSSGQVETPITGFTSLKSITWFAGHDVHAARSLDDLYLSGGDTPEECYLGASTKIYRLALNGDGVLTQWTTNNSNSQFSNLNNADGDINYAYAPINFSGLISTYSMDNLPSVPSGDLSIIVKPINIVRKTSTINNAKFINVMNSGAGASFNLGSEHIVTSNTYAYTESNYITTNPITGNPWTVNEINNMQIGIKNLGASPLT